MPNSTWTETGSSINLTPVTSPISDPTQNSPNYLTNADKIALMQQYAAELAMKSQLDTTASGLGVPTTNYDNAVAGINTTLLNAGAPSNWATIWPDGTTFGPSSGIQTALSGDWAGIATARTSLQSAISATQASQQATAAQAAAVASAATNAASQATAAQTAAEAAAQTYANGLISNLTGTIGSGNLCYNCDFAYSSGGVPAGFAIYDNGGVPTPVAVADGGALGTANYWRITAGAAVTNTFGFYFISAVTSFGGWQANTNYVVSFYARVSSNPANCVMSAGWNHGPAAASWLTNPVLSTSWQRYIFSLNFGNGTIDPQGFFTLSPYSFPNGAYIDFSCIQVERGNVATAWGGPITASQIAANTITANQIAAGAITTNSLTVADWSNLCYNPIFADGMSCWADGSGSCGVMTQGSYNGSGTTTALVIPAGLGTFAVRNANLVPVCAGQSYIGQAWVYLSATPSSGSVYIRLRGLTGAGPEYVLANSSNLTSAGWTQLTVTGTLPSGTAISTLNFEIVSASTAGAVTLVENCYFRRMGDASLIVDGSITAAQLQVGTAQADIVNAGGLNAAVANIYNINASNITTGTLSASKVLFPDGSSLNTANRVQNSILRQTATATSSSPSTPGTAISGFSASITVASTADVFNFFGAISGGQTVGTAGFSCYVNLYVDGVYNQAVQLSYATLNGTVSNAIVMILTGLSAGTHTLQFYLSAANAGQTFQTYVGSNILIQRIF